MDNPPSGQCPSCKRPLQSEGPPGEEPLPGSALDAVPDLEQGDEAPICVALIEDNRLVREGISLFLGRFPDFRVVVAASSGNYASAIGETDAQVFLLSLGLGNEGTLEIMRALHARYPGIRILLTDLVPSGERLVDFIAAGARGFVLKDASPEVVMGTIRAVAAGWTVIPTAITDRLFAEIARRSVVGAGSGDDDSERVTPREREVIELVAEGLSNKAISRRLGISVHTVKSHLRNVMDKMSLHSRLQIAKHVHEHAQSDPEPEASPLPEDPTPPPSGPTTDPRMGRTPSRSGIDAPERSARPGAERGTSRSTGRPRRRDRPSRRPASGP